MQIKRYLQIALEKLNALDMRESMLDRQRLKKVQAASLLFYYGNIHSQRGQDGILAEIFRRLRIDKGYFVEFGAWDGIYLSNSRLLFEKGWRGCFIEGNFRRFKRLTQIYGQLPEIKMINAMVGAPNYGVIGSDLGTILTQHNVNLNDVSFVSIDVDGPDLEIFLNMGFKPPAVLLEGGFGFSPLYTDEVEKKIAWNNLQQPLPVIINHGIEMGYTPVCFYQDVYFIRTDLLDASLLSIKTDPLTLYSNAIAFMPFNYLDDLLTFRDNSEIIRTLESKFFGMFKKHPMDYLVK